MICGNAQIDMNVMSELVHDGYIATNMSDEELEQSRAEYNNKETWPTLYESYYVPDILRNEPYCVYQWLGDELDMKRKSAALCSVQRKKPLKPIRR